MRHSTFEYLQNDLLFRSEISHFAVVAELKNISRAADFLGISQPQVSKSIASLESLLKTTLLIRKSRGVELTLEGQRLLEKIQQIQSLLQSQNAALESVQVVRIGMHPSIALQNYPFLIHPLHLEFPNFRIETVFQTSLEITRQVADLKIDFGLVINPLKNPDIVAKKLESDFVGVWAQRKVPNSGILYYHPDMLKINRLLKRFEHFQKVPIADYEVIAEILHTQKNAVGILPQAVAKRYELSQAIEDQLLTVDLSLIAHREKLKSPQMKSFFQKILKNANLRT